MEKTRRKDTVPIIAVAKVERRLGAIVLTSRFHRYKKRGL